MSTVSSSLSSIGAEIDCLLNTFGNSTIIKQFTEKQWLLGRNSWFFFFKKKKRTKEKITTLQVRKKKCNFHIYLYPLPHWREKPIMQRDPTFYSPSGESSFQTKPGFQSSPPSRYWCLSHLALVHPHPCLPQALYQNKDCWQRLRWQMPLACSGWEQWMKRSTMRKEELC